ncbi:cell surface protein [Lactiplantibacillus fabifermentans T30PCM01]|uniref:Cell surface protein n=1 Tax=Lactiplantibacillus fabifermentans T30PCM01 TaxID=1400520 RepID=W6T7P4_9LACO|nr:DUF916 and DUF3324 domain-containing protein [Lactiplantibacillus fabifermentans]ETY73913.1 cell surface protein [Lactiplantibacillus fabifermentans T30PCM01]
MKKKIWSWLFLGLSLFVIGLLRAPRVISAAAQPPVANFIVTPLLPKNQLSSKDSYFNLKVTPGSTQILKIAVSNPSTTPRTLKISPVNATTADVGSAEYVPSDRSDPSATTTFTKMTSPAVTISLAAKQGKTITFKTTIPKNGFKGEVLGALFVTDLQKISKSTNGKQTFKMENRYAESTAVALWCDPKTPIPVNLQLTNVTVTTNNGLPAVHAKIRNLAPILFGDLQIKSQVMAQATGKTVTTQTLKSGSVAPNSWFNYGISLGDHNLSAGRYTLKMQLTSGQRHWHFTRQFTLTAPKAQQHNQQLPKHHAGTNWWLWGSLAAILVIAISGGAYWLGRRRTRQE